MTPEIARNALVFMERVELRGSEVQAWMMVVAALKEVEALQKPKVEKK